MSPDDGVFVPLASRFGGQEQVTTQTMLEKSLCLSSKLRLITVRAEGHPQRT